MLPKKKKKREKVLLPTGVSKSKAHTVTLKVKSSHHHHCFISLFCSTSRSTRLVKTSFKDCAWGVTFCLKALKSSFDSFQEG
jgi:hypothetical protein